MSEHTVGEVAALAGVSVRTLHHYDAVGLLSPSGRSAAGYRLYSDADLARLRQILFYRELDFGLDDIAAMLADSGVTVDDHLRRQHRLLRDRITRDHNLLTAVEKEMEARTMGVSLTPEEQFELFGEDGPKSFGEGEWAREAEQRWGDTEAWAESKRRTSAYTKEDWARVKEELDANLHEFAAAMAAGEPPDSTRALAAAEEHRAHICRWFYDCGYDMHRCLGEMYVSDERFTANFEKVAAGLAQYVSDAIVANAAARQ
jgi:DNA-binding transcriptional MerR regulator